MLKLLLKFFKQKFVFAGAPVIIQNSKGEILLGKRDEKSLYYPSMWGLPGGMIEYGERITYAIRREILEELGVEIEITKVAKTIQENLPNDKCKIHTIDITHYAKIIKGEPQAKDETSEVKWFSPKEIKEIELAYSHKEFLEKEGLI